MLLLLYVCLFSPGRLQVIYFVALRAVAYQVAIMCATALATIAAVIVAFSTVVATGDVVAVASIDVHAALC